MYFTLYINSDLILKIGQALDLWSIVQTWFFQILKTGASALCRDTERRQENSCYFVLVRKIYYIPTMFVIKQIRTGSLEDLPKEFRVTKV